MNDTVKTTVLNNWHKARGANMAVFGGYDMPLWYASAKSEHLAVLQAAGLFDTSHMALVTVNGADAFDLLQHCFTNDMAACIGPSRKPLVPGRCVYGAFLQPNGHVIDDAIVFQMTPEHYTVVVNAGMGAAIADQLIAHADGRSVEITDLTDKVGKIDIQGLAAIKIMAATLENPTAVFDGMPYFSFKGHFDPNAPCDMAVRFAGGISAMVSRTGYTGEIGFEIFCAPADTVTLWQMLLEAGKDQGLVPCGLAARDSLRAGAVLPLSHQDIGHWPFVRHPWPFALPYTEDGKRFTKSFIGDQALLDSDGAAYTLPFAGFDLRKVTVDDDTVVVDDDGRPMGRVLTCATDMGIGRSDGRIFSVASTDRPEAFKPKGLCCGFIQVKDHLAVGHQVTLKDKRRKLKVEIADDIRPDRTARRPLKDFM